MQLQPVLNGASTLVARYMANEDGSRTVAKGIINMRSVHYHSLKAARIDDHHLLTHRVRASSQSVLP